MGQKFESTVEEAALEWLSALDYAILHGPELAAGQPFSERDGTGYRDVILEGRLRQSLQRLNPQLPVEAIDDAYRRLTCTDESSILLRNHAFHALLVDGVTVEYTRPDGSIGGALVRVHRFRKSRKQRLGSGEPVHYR